MATEFFAECFSPSQDQLELIRSKYILWATLRDAPYLYEYYDMSRGQVFALRGADYSDQLEVCEESAIPIKIGLGCKVFPSHVIRKIEEMRSITP